MVNVLEAPQTKGRMSVHARKESLRGLVGGKPTVLSVLELRSKNHVLVDHHFGSEISRAGPEVVA